MENHAELRNFIKKYVEERLPGYLSLLNNISLQRHGKLFLDLLLECPSKAYQILVEYHGDSSVADFALVNFFIRPLAMKLNRIGYEFELLKLVKERKDKEFFGILGIQIV